MGSLSETSSTYSSNVEKHRRLLCYISAASCFLDFNHLMLTSNTQNLYYYRSAHSAICMILKIAYTSWIVSFRRTQPPIGGAKTTFVLVYLSDRSVSDDFWLATLWTHRHTAVRLEAIIDSQTNLAQWNNSVGM